MSITDRQHDLDQQPAERWAAIEAHASPVMGYQVVDDRQAQAGALPRCFRGVEGFKNAGPIFFRNPSAGVGDSAIGVQQFVVHTHFESPMELTPESRAAIQQLPGSLDDALIALEQDYEFLLAGDVFTKSQLEGYMELKWEEVYAYEHTPHPVEYKLC